MNTFRLTTTAATLLALGLSLSTTAQAGALIGTASATLDQLSYQLVDLDPNDGITPAVLFSGQWGGVFGSAGTIFDIPRSDPMPSKPIGEFDPFEDIAPQGPFMAAPSPLSAISADGSSTVTMGNGSFSATTRLTTDDLLYASREGTLPVDELGQTPPGDYLTRDSFATGEKLAEVMVSPDGVAQTHALIYNTVELSPNTLLLIKGRFSASAFGDRSTLASLPNDPTPLSGGGVGHAMGSLMMELVDSESLNSGGVNGTASSVALNKIVFMTRDALGYTNPDLNDGENPVLPVSEQTLTQSGQWDWTLQYMNASASAKTLSLSTAMEATVGIEARQLDYTNVPELPPVIIDPDTGTIPEPGTYALMGLGLVGIALVRRHAAR